MNAAAIYRKLQARGVELFLEDGRLRYRCPQGALTPELRDQAKAHRGELIAMLRGAAVPCPTCHGPTDTKARCWGCCERVCSQCGRPTGTAFIELCMSCGLASRN